MKNLILLILLSFLFITCGKKETVIEPSPGHTVTIKAGDLKVIFIDNTEFGEHPDWHNGIAHLSHKSEATNFFRNKAVGLNFEHMFDGEKFWETRETYFEPRSSLMNVKKISERTVELHQPPSTYRKLESWTRFTITGDHYIDIEFSCIPRAETFDRGYIGLFWASYPALSQGKGFHYIGVEEGDKERKWLEHKTPAHNVSSTVKYENDKIKLTFNKKYKATLYNNFSNNRYSYPFYYGEREKMVYIIMFDQAGPVRFAHSPNSGMMDDTVIMEPAWDFQYIIPDYKAGKKYGYKARVVYKPFISREDVIAEYERWSGQKVKLQE